ERREDPPPLDHRRDAARGVEERAERGVRPAAAEPLQALLAAAHAGQPVVNQNDSRESRVHARRLQGRFFVRPASLLWRAAHANAVLTPLPIPSSTRDL